jgi:2-dehydropantoate 2-reductase
LRDALTAVQEVAITDNIFGFLWAKMALGAIYFGTALVSADVTDIYANDGYRHMLGTLAGEVVAVADASGVRIESFDGFDPNVFRPGSPGTAADIARSWDGQRRYWEAHGPNSRRTGVWRDLAQHHRPTEVAEQVGTVVAIAAERGIATPRLSALVQLVHDAEAGRPLGWHLLDELATLDRSLMKDGHLRGRQAS